MNHPRYEIRRSDDYLHYVFVSEGPKGHILKLVDYAYLDDIGIWNLGFGDYDLNTGRVDDRVVSDNRDGRKVLATVVATLMSFFEHHPEATVLFTGSTAIRIRVYGRIIATYYQEFSAEFVVTGLDDSFNEYPFDSALQFAAYQIKKVN